MANVAGKSPRLLRGTRDVIERGGDAGRSQLEQIVLEILECQCGALELRDQRFATLEQVVHFYNTQAVKPVCQVSGLSAEEAIAADCWPEPETPSILPLTGLVGDLGLTEDEEAALVAYLKTLTDTEIVKAPKPYKAH